MDPKPVDTSKLMSILSKSKNLMKTVESGNYKTGNIDASALNEDTSQYVSYNPNEGHTPSTHVVANYSEEQVRNSRLPEAIKKIMIEKPIPKMSGPNHTFNLEDVSELIEKPVTGGYTRLPKAGGQKAPIMESHRNSDMLTISREELTDMVSELVNQKLLEFFVQNHNKRITEDTIKILMKEGKFKKTL